MGKGPRKAKKGLLELDEPGHAAHATPAPQSTQSTHPPQRVSAAPAEGVESGIGPAPLPTIVPKFDPSRYAVESEIRERMPTFTDEAVLEQARLQSLPSNLPPPRRMMSTVPGPLVPNMRDSLVEIDTGEADLETLDSETQVALLTERLAPLSRVPSLAREMSELGSFLADPKTAYVLGFVDGILPLETIIDVTGLPELETLRVLERMVSQAVVVFRSRR